VSGVLLWAAFPPLGYWPLAWVAPLGWLWLIRVEELPGRRPLLSLYLASALHWMLLTEWVRLPHWAAYFGWAAMTFWFSLFLFFFPVLTRVAVHRWRVPLVLAAPLVWMGLEYLRGWGYANFSMALLAHSQIHWLSLLQISDLGGAYLPGFVMILVGAAVVSALPFAPGRRSWWPLPVAAAVLAATLFYGHWRLDQIETTPAGKTIKVALIQESVDTVFGAPEDEDRETFLKHVALSKQAKAENPDLDLIVWPESMFIVPVVTEDRLIPHRRGLPLRQDLYLRLVEQSLKLSPEESPRVLRTPLLVGAPARHHEGKHTIKDRYNTALLLDARGNLVGRYDKMHPILFGEFIPLGKTFPALYKLTPMQSGLAPGARPALFTVNGVKISPSICFETTAPHLIRRQVAELADRDAMPDVLVSVTNDGWFWGSAALDLHFYCSVFRAIEMRRPMLIAANTGFSAWVDPAGRVIERGPRRDKAIVIAEVGPRTGQSWYLKIGDWPAALGLLFCVAAAVGGALAEDVSRVG